MRTLIAAAVADTAALGLIPSLSSDQTDVLAWEVASRLRPPQSTTESLGVDPVTMLFEMAAGLDQHPPLSGRIMDCVAFEIPVDRSVREWRPVLFAAQRSFGVRMFSSLTDSGHVLRIAGTPIRCHVFVSATLHGVVPSVATQGGAETPEAVWLDLADRIGNHDGLAALAAAHRDDCAAAYTTLVRAFGRPAARLSNPTG